MRPAMRIAVLVALAVGVATAGGCGDGEPEQQNVRRIVDAGAVDLVLNAEHPEQGFGEFPNALSFGADIRASLLAVQLLQSTGGVPDEPRFRLTQWLAGLVSDDGWVTELGSYEELDVAILVLRASEALDATAAIQVDVDRIAYESLKPAPLASVGSRVARMAWARHALGGFTDPERASLLAQLDGAIAEALGEIDPQDIRDAAGLSQSPTTLNIEPSLRARLRETLRAHSYRTSGAWSEHLLGLHMLGEAAAQDYADAFTVATSLGAPDYWGQVGPVEAVLLVEAPDVAIPDAWGPRQDWLASLRNAILRREAASGGFHPPVATTPTVSATAAAALVLYYGGADGELLARSETWRDVLCEPADDGNDPLVRALLLRHATNVLGLECEQDIPSIPGDATLLHTHLHAYLTGETVDVECRFGGDKKPDYIAVLVASMSLRGPEQESYVRGCLSPDDLAAAIPHVASVYELYAVVSLKIIADVGLDTDDVEESLRAFRRGSGFGEREEADLGSTCQALVIRTSVENYRFIPVFCLI